MAAISAASLPAFSSSSSLRSSSGVQRRVADLEVLISRCFEPVRTDNRGWLVFEIRLRRSYWRRRKALCAAISKITTMAIIGMIPNTSISSMIVSIEPTRPRNDQTTTYTRRCRCFPRSVGLLRSTPEERRGRGSESHGFRTTCYAQLNGPNREPPTRTIQVFLKHSGGAFRLGASNRHGATFGRRRRNARPIPRTRSPPSAATRRAD